MNAKNAREMIDTTKEDRSDIMSHPITYFNDEDKTIIMELARLALADAGTFDRFAESMDLSEDYLLELRDRVEASTNGVDIYSDE